MKISRVAIKIKRFALKLKNNTLRNFFTYYKYSKCSEDRVATFIRIWESFIFVWKILLEPSVSSSIETATKRRRRRKKNCILNEWKANISMERNTFSKLACFLLISFIESSPRVFENFRGNRGFSRQRNIDFTTVSKTFPTSPFFPFLPSFFFFTMGKIFSSSNTS